MRHIKDKKKFNLSRNHCKLMFINMCNSLICYNKIVTTFCKSKELKRQIEPLINRSKIDSIYNRRFIFSILRNKKNVNKLFEKIGPKYINRNGGYTKILKYKFRKGDNSLLSMIKFT